ncbi:hypothetical protein N7495_008770 [Penicillium taxi]|uniref:uncharacterized protein n=1 Tax=Penicillium taxi TaxID=168475 RepID=UPI0025451016|nr:uncharacterized protein N7495_008770 [Penicillium taxi]KAJ5888729.1 hypothetical protein N7495_008770 [Penicillium taxi]
MAESSPPELCTPPVASVKNTTTSESMEDTNSHGTRKRPRLDNGADGACDLMPVDGPFDPSANAADMDIEPGSGGHPSKVTINVKSPSSNSHNKPSSSPRSSLAESESHHSTNPPNVISISSSPTSSPQIQVADLEDLDQSPNPSNWRPLEDALREHQEKMARTRTSQTSLSPVDSFPRLRTTLNPMENLLAVVDVIDQGDARGDKYLLSVMRWFEDLADACETAITPEVIANNRDFWDDIPKRITSFLRFRSLPLQDGQSYSYWEAREDIFLAFATITLRLVRMDMMVLDSDEPEMPDSFSQDWLQILIWNLNHSLSSPHYSNFVKRVQTKLLASPFNLVTEVAGFVALILNISTPQHPHLVHILPMALSLASTFLDKMWKPDLESEESSDAPSYVHIIYEMVRSINSEYQEWIAKKVPWLSSELSLEFVRYFGKNYSILCDRDPKYAQQISEELSVELPENEKGNIAQWIWKFNVLKKHIMEGRMELRVQGVETMQTDLVWMFQDFESRGSPALTQALIRFIRENMILDYLVGVDSHPQLISRAVNIFGFFIVARCYTNAETDIIWKNVIESQDSRNVSVRLTMLIDTFYMHTACSPELQYICQKALELPLERFDSRMLKLCESLFYRLTDNQDGAIHYCEATPLRLCVRLIRESTAAPGISFEQKRQLQAFGSNQLQGFIRYGITDLDRMEMYERCIQDIAEMNQFTVGSIQVLNALIPSHQAQEIWRLATEFDLTRLVINDLLHTVKESHFDFKDAFSQHGLTSRVAIMFRLIDVAPETITSELGNALWNEVLISDKLGVDGHRSVWSGMNQALSRCTQPNLFLDRCLNEYFPQLEPSNLSHELLAFAKQAIGYEVRANPASFPRANENEVVTIPRMDLIWNFILTAPTGSVEEDAIKFAIEVYLDNQIIRTSPPSAVEATHIALVNRCIDQLNSAATSLKALEKTPNSDNEKSGLELEFRRSILFLRQFLYGLRIRPHYSPAQATPPQLPLREQKGDPISISWQAFNGTNSSKVNTLCIGSESTAAELVERLTQLAGFSKLTSIWGGHRIDLLENPDAFVKEILLQGLLIVRRAPDAQELVRASRGPPLSSVDSEVLKHFDEIYDLLTLKEDLAREAYVFLAAFDAQERISQLVRSSESNEDDLFPLQSPFIALYSFKTLAICLREESLQTIPNQDFLSHSIGILMRFLLSDELLICNRERLHLTFSAVNSFFSAISICQSSDESAVIPDGTRFIKRLLDLIEISRSPEAVSLDPAITHSLTCRIFAVLMEGSLRDYNFWNLVKQELSFGLLVQTLLLQETRQAIRIDIAETITLSICNRSKMQKRRASMVEDTHPVSDVETPVRIDMIATIWSYLVRIIPNTPEYAGQTAEFFNVAYRVFTTVVENSPRDVVFGRYFKEWTQVMLRHQTDEFVGRPSNDQLVLGFTFLLELCLEQAEAANINLEYSALAEEIVSRYLFPNLSSDHGPVTPLVPIMPSMTRQKLLKIISLLCKRSDDTFHKVVNQLQELVPRGVYSSSADADGPNSPSSTDFSLDDMNMDFDIPLTIRAPEGYAGLQNLSNTCYLNSLMTQLFMNVEFRDFMLRLHLVDPDSSQKLLDETQKLFAWMQGTWRKSYDPQSFVESIRTYDNEAIDVTIQMDVDEFYNLLFDRWESQIVDGSDKRKFRSFYGGQLVQQIKSMECSHISERLEPFSAIQCDIKGKATLNESLKAYVEGEIMQGDNKYSCTGCDRHVDAVKRACLKEVPNNLIFHLKRFDFDMVNMLRSKINDEFQFPGMIDMTPYKVEYLSDPSANIDPDIFELVGVLVHTGTAESGHYYSYTRERPVADSTASWVEFNDSDVSKFDQTRIPDQCFGGSSIGNQMNKSWNAYMLFYQRKSEIETLKEVYNPPHGFPVQVPVPSRLAKFISLENEIFIRRYCLLDPWYADLVQHLLEHLPRIAYDYPHREVLEISATDVGLDTFEQLTAQNRDYVSHEDIYASLYKLLSRNPLAALQVLKWAGDRPSSLRNLILKPNSSEARQQGITLVVRSLTHLQIRLRDPNSKVDLRSKVDAAVEQLVKIISALWTAVQLTPRAWDDYFDLIVQLVDCRFEIAGLLLEQNFFFRILQIMFLDPDDLRTLGDFCLNYCRSLERGRKFIYTQMMVLCVLFFKSVDFMLPSVSARDIRRLSDDGKYPPSVSECALICPCDPKDCTNIFLMRMLQNETIGAHSYIRKVFGAFVTATLPMEGALKQIIKTLENGLRFSPADACIPFLAATLEFCEIGPSKHDISQMIAYAAKGVESIDNHAGKEHAQLFRLICGVANEELNLSPDWFTSVVQDVIPDFAPTLLLYADDAGVRRKTLELITGLLFEYTNENDPDDWEVRRSRISRELLASCLEQIRASCLQIPVRRLETNLVSAITSATTRCLDYLTDDEDDQQAKQSAQDILGLLEKIVFDDPEDLVSESELPSPDEWEAMSMASDSDLGIARTP